MGRVAPSLDVQDGPQPAVQHLPVLAFVVAGVICSRSSSAAAMASGARRLIVLGTAVTHAAATYSLAHTHFVLVPFFGYFRWPVGVPLLAIATALGLAASSWRSLAGGATVAVALARAPWPRYYRRPVERGDWWPDDASDGDEEPHAPIPSPVQATPGMLLDAEGTLLLSLALAPEHQAGWILAEDADPWYSFLGMGWLNFGGSNSFGALAPPALYGLQQRAIRRNTSLLPRLAAHWGVARRGSAEHL